MASFAFIPRSVKKKAAPSGQTPHHPETNASSTQRRDVSSTTPVAGTSTLASSARSERVVSTGQSSDVRTDASDVKGKSRETHLPGRPSGDDGIRSEVGATSSNSNRVKPTTEKGPELKELSSFVCLALSDYQLWADTDLRKKIDWGVVDDSGIHGEDTESGEPISEDDSKGYIPLDYLVHHSPIFLHPNTIHPETLLVKAARAHASRLLDVRLVLASEDPAHGNRWSQRNDVQTGYQVRRKTRPMEKSKNEWDSLTIYLENIPAHLRRLSGVFQLVSSLLPPTSTSSPSRVQSITFPAHHRDRPGAVPTCKGFALVVLADGEDVQYLLRSYPWNAPDGASSSSATQAMSTSDISEEISAMKRDALRFGLRILLKSRWEELKAEYLLYRQQLVDEINLYQETEAPHAAAGGATHSQPQRSANKKGVAPASESAPIPQPAPAPLPNDISPAIHPNSPFPSGCLIFARRVNMETNKTTLRSLFSQCAKNAEKSVVVGDGIDYVDYMKGMDNCHLRLSTPAHATQLLSYFAEHPTIQTSGLDGMGKQVSVTESGSTGDTTISLELVLGKREQVYWEKVPEKVRRQAVEKALSIIHGVSGTGGQAEHDDSGRKQKRRKRG